MKMKIMLLLEVLIYGNRLMVGLLGTYLEVVVIASDYSYICRSTCAGLIH